MSKYKNITTNYSFIGVDDFFVFSMELHALLKQIDLHKKNHRENETPVTNNLLR